MWAKIQLKYYRLNKWLIKCLLINYIYNHKYFLQEMWILLGVCLTYEELVGVTWSVSDSVKN